MKLINSNVFSFTYFRGSPNFLTLSQIVISLINNIFFLIRLLCALAVIAERKELVENLIPNQYNPYGVFHVRLYMNGQWKTVIIDDLLPCDENGRMFFSRVCCYLFSSFIIENLL